MKIRLKNLGDYITKLKINNKLQVMTIHVDGRMKYSHCRDVEKQWRSLPLTQRSSQKNNLKKGDHKCKQKEILEDKEKPTAAVQVFWIHIWN